MRRARRTWWPVASWAAAIVLLTLTPVSGPGAVSSAPYLDKLVHFGLYLGLGWSLGRALVLSRRATLSGLLAALTGGVGFAAANEWLQRFAPTRVPSAADWLADVAGVSLGMVLYLWPSVRRGAG